MKKAKEGFSKVYETFATVPELRDEDFETLLAAVFLLFVVFGTREIQLIEQQIKRNRDQLFKEDGL
ncbi:MAG: hypothetical protein LBV67_02000, partial [Streptococcaceae bacterium]|nr:hypothetical protein [Streptococcaceae bacterium]